MANKSDPFLGASLNGDEMLFKGMTFKPVVEQCENCTRVGDLEGKKFCSGYTNPAAKWSTGTCNFSTIAKNAEAASKTKVNPLKASKRAVKRK